MEFDEKLMKRIWSAINKTDTCWLSNKQLDVEGYSRIQHNLKLYKLHRLMLFWNDQTKTAELLNDKLHACHTCRNKNCVNPDHLYWGTAKENVADSIRDGTRRDTKGENCGTAKLTAIQVLEIRDKHSKGDKQNKIAKEYGVHKATINDIVLRKNWSHLPQTPD
jgi:hypothetical protein